MISRLAVGLAASILLGAPALAANGQPGGQPGVSEKVSVCSYTYQTRCVEPSASGSFPLSPSNSPSGVTATTCTITTATTCAVPATGAGSLIAGRDFHVSHKLTGFTGSCQWERQTDGTNWYTVTVTAGGSTTQMYNWSFSASTQNISEDLSEPQNAIAQRLNCTSVSAGTDVVTITQ